MYLSRLVLNPLSHQVRRDLADLYDLHRTVMRAFPAADEGGPGRVLFRVDEPSRGNLPILLVQSQVQPDWTVLPPLYLGAGGAVSKEWQPAFQAGQVLRFRLRFNPTVKKQRDDKQAGHKGYRVALFKEDKQQAWLTRKLEAAGAQLVQCTLAREGKDMGWRPATGGASAQKLTLLAVRADGVLCVVDPARLAAAVQAGLGSAKGFGFGLLSLAPY